MALLGIISLLFFPLFSFLLFCSYPAPGARVCNYMEWDDCNSAVAGKYQMPCKLYNIFVWAGILYINLISALTEKVIIMRKKIRKNFFLKISEHETNHINHFLFLGIRCTLAIRNVTLTLETQCLVYVQTIGLSMCSENTHV